jgi:hypothetical protein
LMKRRSSITATTLLVGYSNGLSDASCITVPPDCHSL